MKVNANSIRVLYAGGKITLEGARQAMERGWITPEEFVSITGELAEPAIRASSSDASFE